MHKWLPASLMLKIGSLLCILTMYAWQLFAQQTDSSNTVTIQIIQAEKGGLVTKANNQSVNRLVGNVQLRQGENWMYCDSADLNTQENFVEAFGAVRIVQPGGTSIESDYLRYTGNTKKAFVKGNVSLTNGADNLWADQLEYDVSTRIGKYSNGGTLMSGNTTVTSNTGIYYSRTKEARFVGEVYVTNPKYEVTSEDLGYNTQTEVVKFNTLSKVTNTQSVLVTKGGTYDAKKGIGQFGQRTSILNKELYVEADQLYYNEKTGQGKAQGKVIGIDTMQRLTLYAEQAVINEKIGSLLAYGWPVMKKMNGDDSLFIKADTFYSAPIPEKRDTLHGKFVERKAEILLSGSLESNDTAATDDSTRPRYFIGFHQVKVFSDSLQAVCDSLSYSQQDSIIRMMYDPILWSRKGQLKGQIILVKTDSSQIEHVLVPGQASMVNEEGPIEKQMFDQVQGDTLLAKFEQGNIKSMRVWPNAESIYYAKDKNDSYIGVNQSKSEEILIDFRGEQITRIALYKDITQSMTPMDKAIHNQLRLSQFSWLPDRRPKSSTELFVREREVSLTK